MKENKNIFWVSYSDLMTSLFFIMLVLFVVTVGYLKIKQRDLVKTTEVLGKIKDSLMVSNHEKDQLLQLESLFDPLIEDGSFIHLSECNKYVFQEFRGKEIFYPESTRIRSEYIESTIEAGRKLEAFLKKLYYQNSGLSYILLIEGNMANTWNHQIGTDENAGYVTSYERALAVYQLWRRKGIDLRKYNTEIMICGSGFNGECRESKEENNKRFSIQIIPKVNYNIPQEP